MRKEFEMTVAQRDWLINKINSNQPLIATHLPPGANLMERVSIAWDILGEEMGFVGSTARPVPGKSELFFTAETVS